MKRVPPLFAILLCLGVVALAWWRGTAGYDFLAKPSATEIETARHHATQELARPSKLFAVPEVDEAPAAPAEPETTDDDPGNTLPRIDPGPLEGEPPLDAWADEAGKPAASFLDLASRLETDTRFPWALLAWERVIDTARPDEDERRAALNGIRRLRQSVDAPAPAEPAAVTLRVAAPTDRIELTRRAAADAGTALSEASGGLLDFRVEVSAREADEPRLNLGFQTDQDQAATLALDAPAEEEGLKNAILTGAFRLVASNLAVDEDISAISSPEPGEAPADSLATRITRRAWLAFAESLRDS